MAAGARSLLIACAMAAMTVLPAQAGGRVALIIGNGAYENLSSLNNPGGDATRMAELLAANGFDVMDCGAGKGCHDLDRGDMLDALDDFSDLSRDADVALVFYAGHGMQTAEGNVIAPVDIEISCDDWRARRAVMLDDVLEAMGGAKEKIVILDACRNDPFKAQQCLQRGARPLSFGSIAAPDSAARFLLVTSTQNGQVAQDGRPGGHSPFAEALFHHMEAEPARRFDQLLDSVTKRVVEQTSAANFTQVPEILIRGGAPEACLAAGGCASDAGSAALRAEVADLKARNARNQEYEEIVVALLGAAGYGDLDSIPEDERRAFFSGIMEAGRALAQKGDEGEVALAALRTGDSGAAEKLFQRDLSVARDRAAEERRRAAQTARHLAALARPGDTGKAAAYYAEAAELDPADAQTWIDLAETSLSVGDSARAGEAYRTAVEVARAGGATLEQRVWASEGLADMEWAGGRLDEAERLYREAASAARQALDEEPFNTGLKRGLLVTQYNIGHLALDEGSYDAALSAFASGLKLAEELAEDDPGNPLWQFDIGRGYERIGRARQAMGELDLALAAYSRKHEIMTGLSAHDPDNPVWTRDLSLADEFLGDVSLASGDAYAALARYETSLARMMPLRDSDPSNTDYQRFTSVTHLKAGDVLEAQGDLDAARRHFEAGMKVSETLVGIDPSNAEWRWDLFRSYQRMASSAPPGVEWHEKALAVIEAMQADGVLGAGRADWVAITRDRLAESRKGAAK